jgi:hypothetical protein
MPPMPSVPSACTPWRGEEGGRRRSGHPSLRPIEGVAALRRRAHLPGDGSVIPFPRELEDANGTRRPNFGTGPKSSLRVHMLKRTNGAKVPEMRTATSAMGRKWLGVPAPEFFYPDERTAA